MATRFGEGLSDGQIRRCREFEAAGLTTFSQAVKAFQRRDPIIAAWTEQMALRTLQSAPASGAGVFIHTDER